MNDRAFVSFFSGIGGFDLGLERAGGRCAGQVELDPYRRSVLERWWPNVPRWDDITTLQPDTIREWVGLLEARSGQQRAARPDGDPGTPDLLCGGFPCTDLSIAGKRAGLQGSQSSLFFEFARLARALRSPWLLVENVPGLLTSCACARCQERGSVLRQHRGTDFAVVISTLRNIGYDVAWRVLDSRFFGVAQRRRRVFVVGHLAARGRGAEALLPFATSGTGSPRPGAAAGTEVASTLGGGAGVRGWCDDFERGGASSLSGQGSGGVVAFHTNQDPISVSELALPLEANEQGVAMALNGHGWRSQADHETMIPTEYRVRRLTVVERCRLQGFPDNWLDGNEPPIGPKEAATGNAVTVPVIEWIGRQWIGRPADA